MATVNYLRDELQRLDGGPVMSPQVGDPSAMAPPARLLWVRSVLAQLGLDSSFLQPAEDLRARASALRAEAATASQQAAARRAAALNTLGRDSQASLAEAVALWSAESAWLDIDRPGEIKPPALRLAEEGARALESQIAVQILGHGEKLFALVQKKAAALVQEISDLPKFPDAIYGSPDPATDLARIPSHRATWGTLTGTNQDFLACHDVANLVRAFIGASVNKLPDGAPRYAFWAKNWRPSLTDDQFPRLKAPLRLRWALDHDWQPGLWRPEDVKTTA
ncbi:MAG TPA: hypothetical protein VJW23_13600, partial [Propionibacteriaceae bacterium]|nr:hypothetical protein [Propionibacteriaceae bacterium]